MAQAARNLERDYTYRSARATKENLKVIRNDGKAASRARAVFALAIVLILSFALICAVRVWFSANTAQALIDTETLTAELESARTEEATLEVQTSTLSNPTRIKEKASKLGMIQTGEVTYVNGTQMLEDAAAPATVFETVSLLSAQTE